MFMNQLETTLKPQELIIREENKYNIHIACNDKELFYELRQAIDDVLYNQYTTPLLGE